MAEEKEVKDFEVPIIWDNGIGEIAADAFTKNLPEGLEEEHFEAVDSYRDQFAAKIGEEMVGMAADHFETNEGYLSIIEYGLGGKATLAMCMNNDFHLTTSITVATNEALEAVNNKAKELYKNQITE